METSSLHSDFHALKLNFKDLHTKSHPPYGHHNYRYQSRSKVDPNTRQNATFLRENPGRIFRRRSVALMHVAQTRLCECVCVCGDDLNSRFRSNLDFPRHCQRGRQPTERPNSSTLAMMGVLIRSHLVYLLFVVGSSVGRLVGIYWGGFVRVLPIYRGREVSSPPPRGKGKGIMEPHIQ